MAGIGGQKKRSWKEKLSRGLGYFLMLVAALSVLAVVVAILRGISPTLYVGSAVFYAAIGYVALTYSNKKKFERMGQSIPGRTRSVLDMATAAGAVYITLAVLAGMDYSLSISHITSELEVTMLGDLLIFQGVIIGFVALLISQDMRDLVQDAERGPFPPGLRETRFHKRRLSKKNSDLIALAFLLAGAFSEWLAIPSAGATANVGYLAIPLQFTVMGIGGLAARMIWPT